MEDQVAVAPCAVCGFERTKPAGTRVPSFWWADFGWEPLEYVHAAIEMRDVGPRGRFDARGHRNQGFRGSGRCERVDCKICYMMNKHGV